MAVIDKDMKWAEETWVKITRKMNWLHIKSAEKIPHSTIDGIHQSSLSDEENGQFAWTNGFWPGMLWLMYSATRDESYRQTAETLELKMDKALYRPEGLHHDVGFMWGLISVAGYKLTNSAESRRRGLIAANFLLSRFQHKGNYIVAWNEPVHEGWSIIDTMMNLPLLHWATAETGKSRYRDAAIAHADKTLDNMLRSDGSVCHIVAYDTQTGELLEEFAGQGYSVGSSWSRGASWAIYGFALAYSYTKEKRYIDAAKRAAHYFICSLLDDYIPLLDFRQPAVPDYRDSSAGAIAACGLLEIAKHVDEREQDMYIHAALKLVRTLEARCCDWSEYNDAILLHGSMAYHWGTERDKDTHLIYGDYFFIEAILKLKGMDISFW